ncbi:hypothetical protein SAMN04489716_4417 [Actinoplanes derwentensis]|uniref:Uncharacterized protein n=1 Tax=Actinoplanes derwentensis TaxID=113562 RepID=A0A1H2B929_9ACTN|nr:hypothetical protein SAMN04489716_4417 [Actinoplanes derwentensis]
MGDAVSALRNVAATTEQEETTLAGTVAARAAPLGSPSR